MYGTVVRYTGTRYKLLLLCLCIWHLARCCDAVEMSDDDSTGLITTMPVCLAHFQILCNSCLLKGVKDGIFNA